jgi:adenylate cyclase
VDGTQRSQADLCGRSGRETPSALDAELSASLRASGIDPDGVGPDLGTVGERLASDTALLRGVTLSARDVAARSGADVAQIVALYHMLGVAVPDPDTPQFTEQGVVFVTRIRTAEELGLSEGPDVLRVIAGAMERVTEAAIAVYVQGPEVALRRRAATVLECARSNLRATELALDIGNGLAPLFRHHMRQAVARQRIIQQGVTHREMARLSVGFVDLVGSTVMQAGLDPRALGDQVSQFESRAFDVIARGGGRLVKFIGYEIMVAAVDPAAGVRIVAELVAAFTDDGTQPRGGLVFGEVLFRHGDYYGPVVNLAARLADAAIPGEALVDASVVGALAGTDVSFEPAGRRLLKGFAEPVAVWSLEPDAGGQAATRR